jgi:hypothetical protein
MKLVEPQPSHLIYPFDGGWTVIGYVVQHVFTRTGVAARQWFGWARTWRVKASSAPHLILRYWCLCVFAGLGLAGVFQYLGAMLFVALFTAIHFGLLVAWSAVAIVTMGVLTLFNAAYASWYRIFVRCPSCYTHMRIPLYVCPGCAAEHSRLWPSAYGVLSHRCKGCGTRLPTLDAIGRRNLVRKCQNPECGHPMNRRIGELTNLHIPVIGGPSAGKSNLIFMSTRALVGWAADTKRLTVEFPDPQHEARYARNLLEFDAGRPLEKTPDITPQAYNVSLKPAHSRVGRILYVYDAAGEAYMALENTGQQKFFDYVDGLLFVVDPFSIDTFVHEHRQEIDGIRTSLRPCRLGVMETYERMIEVLEQSMGVKPHAHFVQPLAVVVSKTDALALEDRIGTPAARRLMAQDPSYVLEGDAIDALVERFLVEHGLGNFVRSLRMRFRHVKFFSGSALGRLPQANEAAPFVPVRALDPMAWILGTLGVTDAVRERSREVDRADWAQARQRGSLAGRVRHYCWDSLKPRKVS